MYETEEQTEKERPRMRRGEEKVTVACRRVLDVVSGRPAWPVARGPWPGLCPRRNAARGPRRGTGRKRERERETARLEGLTRPRRARERERETESPGVGGQNAFSLVLLLCLASSSKLLRRVPTPSSFSPFLSLFLSAFLSLPRALLCARTHARSCARVVGRVALSPGGWFRDVPLCRVS